MSWLSATLALAVVLALGGFPWRLPDEPGRGAVLVRAFLAGAVLVHLTFAGLDAIAASLDPGKIRSTTHAGWYSRRFRSSRSTRSYITLMSSSVIRTRPFTRSCTIFPSMICRRISSR